ncbi:26S proteasome complex subunit SEM1 [Coemansia sp. BCRC 34301]|nr:26S proteasome complex subunit SEM1 [Coemansia sp. BCRC 34301]
MSTQKGATADNKAEQTISSSDQAAQQKPPTMGALEEDDEFEEFDVEAWDNAEEDTEDITLWDDNWDDDDLEDDFSKQLRVELEKVSQPEAMAVSS